MKCELCPRMCGVDRSEKRGFCGMSDRITAAKAMLHYWEEPCISGERGSGAVFFSGCVMKCVFCQNYGISSENMGREITEERLAEIFLELQGKGAQNINLVNPTHFVPQILRSIEAAKHGGLTLPIVYNSGGYERVETLRMLEGAVDIYLPDVKFFADDTAKKLASAPGYFDTAMNAIAEMIRQTGKPRFDENGAMISGVIVRHLVLPGRYKDSIEVIRRLGECFGDKMLFSLMSQYTPFGESDKFPELQRKITAREYNLALEAVKRNNLTKVFLQDKDSSDTSYIPEWDF